MAKVTTAPATTTASLAAQLGTKVLTAAQFGGQRPPVTTATRYAAPVVQAILAYAANHTNAQTKAQYGCSAHYVGALRKKHGLPLYVAPKAAAPVVAAPIQAPAPKAPKGKAKAPAPVVAAPIQAKGKAKAPVVAAPIQAKAPAPKGKTVKAAKLVAGSIL